MGEKRSSRGAKSRKVFGHGLDRSIHGSGLARRDPHSGSQRSPLSGLHKSARIAQPELYRSPCLDVRVQSCRARIECRRGGMAFVNSTRPSPGCLGAVLKSQPLTARGPWRTTVDSVARVSLARTAIGGYRKEASLLQMIRSLSCFARLSAFRKCARCC